jgi:hypothetical protein
MNNPCRDCELLSKDKNSEECAECQDRLNYLRFLKNPEDFKKKEKPVKAYVASIYGNQKQKKRPWLDEEKEFLRKNFWRYTVVELADILDRTQNTVSNMLCKLGINKTESMFRKIVELEERLLKVEEKMDDET